MLYTRAHVRSLEAQIAELKQTYSEQLGRLDQAYSAQLGRLEHLLAEERKERKRLLDRLLAKNNVEPVADKPQPRIPDTVQVLSPFGNSATPEIVEALKESWVNEESVYLQAEHGMTEAQAKETAEKRWISEHRVIE